MTGADKIVAARDQLNRTLAFFTRVDSKASVVFGVDTALLAVLATRALPWGHLRLEWFPIALTLFLLGISLWHLYQEAFPSLEGGEGSLLYFSEISKRSDAKYIDDWNRMAEQQHLDDLLGQIWRNSEILRKKFEHLKSAFNALALALLPWLISLTILTFTAGQSHGNP